MNIRKAVLDDAAQFFADNLDLLKSEKYKIQINVYGEFTNWRLNSNGA
jgi:hypothetical protein